MTKEEVLKELRDQSLHFGIGFLITLLLTKIMPVLLAMAIVMASAWTREIFQRIEKGNPWYQCHSGCQFDLLFWATGIFSGACVGWTIWG